MKSPRLTLNGILLSPAQLSRVQDSDQLTLTADSSTAALEPGKRASPPRVLLAGWPRVARGRHRRAAPPAGHAAQQRRAGRTLRPALAGATGQPGRPAHRPQAGLLSARRPAGKLSPRRKGRGGRGRRQLQHNTLAELTAA